LLRCTYLGGQGNMIKRRNAMITKSALVLAAAVVAGCATAAQADYALDANTGLRTELYYQPLTQLEQRGVPIKARAERYATEHAAPYAVRHGGAAYPVDNGFNARAQVPGPEFQSEFNYRSEPQRTPEFDSSGAPVGPYPFE
jgi:hypothetical protein